MMEGVTTETEHETHFISHKSSYSQVQGRGMILKVW